MSHMFPKPNWTPSEVPTSSWTNEHLRKYLKGQHFAVFRNGSSVVWPKAESLDNEEIIKRLTAVVTHHPDFKVRKHNSGDYLVAFRGGVGGVVSGELLLRNLAEFRREAFSKGMLQSELLKADIPSKDGDLDLIAGLYARARLYLDAQEQVITDIFKE